MNKLIMRGYFFKRLCYIVLCSSYSLALFPVQSDARESLHFASIKDSSLQKVAEKMVREIYKRADIDIFVTEMPAKRANREANEGRKDGELLRIRSYAKNKKNLVMVPIPLGQLELQMFTQPHKKLELDKLGSYSFATGKGRKLYSDLTKGKGYKNVFELTHYTQVLNFVRIGRVDIGLTNRVDGLHLIRKNQIKNVTPYGEPLSKHLLYHFLHKKHQPIIPKITAIMDSMEKSGELSSMWDRYSKEIINSDDKN